MVLLKDNLVFIVMFFVYSLNLENYNIRLYDFCRTKDGLADLLENAATNFILREEGERRSESPYRDDIEDKDINQDGYFLRHSKDKANQIDVYQRKTQIIPGTIWDSYDVSCKKVMHFSVTEAALGLPIECTGKGVTTQTFSTSKEALEQNDHIAALKERLVSRREVVDRQIAESEVSSKSSESASSNSSESESEDSYDDSEDIQNPLVRLRNMIEAEEKTLSPVNNEEITYIPDDVDKIIEMLMAPCEKIQETQDFLGDMVSDRESASTFRPPTPPPMPNSPLIQFEFDNESESESESESTFFDSSGLMESDSDTTEFYKDFDYAISAFGRQYKYAILFYRENGVWYFGDIYDSVVDLLDDWIILNPDDRMLSHFVYGDSFEPREDGISPFMRDVICKDTQATMDIIHWYYTQYN